MASCAQIQAHPAAGFPQPAGSEFDPGQPGALQPRCDLVLERRDGSREDLVTLLKEFRPRVGKGLVRVAIADQVLPCRPTRTGGRSGRVTVNAAEALLQLVR